MYECDNDVKKYMNPPSIKDVLNSDVVYRFDYDYYWQSFATFAAYLSVCKNKRDRFICSNSCFVDGNVVLPDQM